MPKQASSDSFTTPATPGSLRATAKEFVPSFSQSDIPSTPTESNVEATSPHAFIPPTSTPSSLEKKLRGDPTLLPPAQSPVAAELSPEPKQQGGMQGPPMSEL